MAALDPWGRPVSGEHQPSPRAALLCKPRLLTRLIQRALSTLAPAVARANPLLAEPLEQRILMSAEPLLTQVNGNLDVSGEIEHIAYAFKEDVRVILETPAPDIQTQTRKNLATGADWLSKGADADLIDISSAQLLDLGTAPPVAKKVDTTGGAGQSTQSVRWVGPLLGGNWSAAANWSTSLVPTAIDDVFIDIAGPATIFISGGIARAGTLTCAANLTLSGGTLELSGV